MGYFKLLVKGLYAGTIYFIAVLMLDSVFPGVAHSSTFTLLALTTTLLLLVLEFFLDFGKAPGAE